MCLVVTIVDTETTAWKSDKTGKIKMSNCVEITQNMKKEFVNSFFEYFASSSKQNNWFVALGNPVPWSFDRNISKSGSIYRGRVTGFDDVVPLNSDTDEEKYEFYRTCTAMKQISKNDVSFVIPKNTWVQNEIYSPYRYDEEMFLLGKKFYVYNPNNRCVYKCIENTAYAPSASGTSAGSQYIPSSTSTDIIDTLDGYKWKLIYQLGAEDELKFSINGRNDSDSYIPVKYIDYTPPTTDDEGELQKSVQDAAVPGSISSIYVNPAYKDLYKYDPNLCAIGDLNAVYVRENASVGATAVLIDYFGTNSATNSLKDMFFQVVDGNGDGQVRLIKNSQRLVSGGSQQLKLTVDPLDYGLSAYVSSGNPGSKVNIIPAIRIYGDGVANSPSNSKDSSLKSALAVPIFDASGILRGSDLVDIGKNYTFASLSIPKGITAVSPSTNPIVPNDSMLVSLAPLGGHGSNAVLELGASRIVVKANFEGSENSVLNATNDFRQVAIIKNPLLSRKSAIVRVNSTAGVSVGSTTNLAVSGGATASAKVISVYSYGGGAEEIIVTNISGVTGNYITINGVNIDANDGLELVTVAGLENKKLTTLKATSSVSVGPRDFLMGVGNKSLGMQPSYACGKVVSVDAGTDVLVENINGSFKEGENVYAMTESGSAVNGFQIAKISNTTPNNFKTTYNMTTKLNITSELDQTFTSSTFDVDQLVYCFADKSVAVPTTTTPFKANGHLFYWKPTLNTLSGGGGKVYNTAVLELVGAKPGNISAGDYILYYKDKSPRYALINSVVEPEISQGSGEVLYVQNLAGVERYAGSKEEINLVLGL